MKRYDAIVVGAGPAGSALAYHLARRSAAVLLLDRAPFPRDKPCGGGVTVRAISQAPVDLTPVVEREVCDVRFTLRLGRSFTHRYPQPLTYMTQRRRLDAYLAQRAAEAGAEFRDGVLVRSIDVEGGGVAVRADGDLYHGRAVAGADGANGVVGRCTGAAPALEMAVALEGNVPLTSALPEGWRQAVALDLGGLPGGYGWVFPKGDHLNAGVGAWQHYGPHLRRSLAALCRRYGFDPNALESLRGHRLPLRVPGSPIVGGPALVVGDAAGLIDPLSGEGIHTAFLSARLAAEAIGRYLAGETRDLVSYQAAVDRLIMPQLIASRKLQDLFHQMPPPYVALLRYSDRFWRACCHLIRGELDYGGFMAKLGPLRPLFEALAAFARRRAWRSVGATAGLARPEYPC